MRASLRGRIARRWSSLLSEDDILQQTFTDAFLDIGRFEPRGAGAFGAWLRRLADHNLTDATRALAAARRGGDRARATAGSSADLLLDQVLASTATPSQVLAREEAAGALRVAVQALPETWRRVVTAYDLEGRPVEELAAELGRSVGAVYLLRNRALRRLAEGLADFASRTG